MKQLFIAFLLGCITMPVLYAQETVTVTGKITDAETGKPIYGATVALEGYNGILTNKKGEYSIDIPLNSKVIFARYYYYGKTYTVDSHHFNVALKPIPKKVQQEMDRRARESASE